MQETVDSTDDSMIDLGKKHNTKGQSKRSASAPPDTTSPMPIQKRTPTKKGKENITHLPCLAAAYSDDITIYNRVVLGNVNRPFRQQNQSKNNQQSGQASNQQSVQNKQKNVSSILLQLPSGRKNL